jgi:hypothetical protein
MSSVDWRQVFSSISCINRQILFLNEQVQTIVTNPHLPSDLKQAKLALISEQLKNATGFMVDSNGTFRSELGQT